jgi:hypothetical protein
LKAIEIKEATERTVLSLEAVGETAAKRELEAVTWHASHIN